MKSLNFKNKDSSRHTDSERKSSTRGKDELGARCLHSSIQGVPQGRRAMSTTSEDIHTSEKKCEQRMYALLNCPLSLKAMDRYSQIENSEQSTYE